MSSTHGKGTLYTFPGNVCGYKAVIAAQYSGAQLQVADKDSFKMNETNRTEEYVTKFLSCRVPTYENDAGVVLFEPNAIAYYLSNDQLRGQNQFEQSQILQWIEYGDREISLVAATLVFPCMGILQFNQSKHERAKEELKNILKILNDYLRTRTYLVGERITLADIAAACHLLLLFQWIIDLSVREAHPHVTRWFLTLINQKEFQAVIGPDYKLCEKTAQFDEKKFAEISHRYQPPQIQPGPKKFPQATGEPAEGGKAKKEKPAKKEKVAEVKPEADDADETDDVYADEPKQKDPFADMPKPTFNMDEFKRVYSNEDTASKAIPYFWKNFDNANCSIWFCEYKYPDELTQVFMTCNLVSGFFQRLEKLRKNAFASMCVFGENNNNTIAGVWVWRGQGLAFELSSDWQVDYDSYSWKRLSIDDENTRNLVNQYFLWEGQHNGKNFNQGKIFK